MKIRETIGRILAGGLLGIGIGYSIAVVFSSIYGEFSPAPPQLIEQVGSLKAAQLLLMYSALIGMVFAGMQFVWEKENWSLFKSTVIYFTVNLASMSFAGYQLYWFPHILSGYISYIIIYVVVFTIMWFIFYMKAKKEVAAMNEKINKNTNVDNPTD